MATAITPAIIAVIPVVATLPAAARDPVSATRRQPREWVPPNALGRGQLIDLVV
jgi:hypothetical protein